MYILHLCLKFDGTQITISALYIVFDISRFIYFATHIVDIHYI
jgi:hypothetical protein